VPNLYFAIILLNKEMNKCIIIIIIIIIIAIINITSSFLSIY